MFIYFQNQKGSAMLVSLLTMVVLATIISGLVPLVNSEILGSSANNDAVEAQYAAEAGAKRAIVGIKNNRTDWLWALKDAQNIFVDGTTKYYTTSISPEISDTATPVANTTYTITSEGYVGKAHKKVTVTVKTAGKASGPFNYAAFSNGTLVFNGGSVKITGDIASNTKIDLSWTQAGSISGYANAPANMVTAGNGVNKVTSGDAKTISNQGTITIPTPASLMPVDPMLSFPTLPIAGGVDLKTFSGSSLTQSIYYYNGDCTLNGTSYTIPSGNSVTIYVTGSFTMNAGSKITGGNVTIYAKNGINFNGGYIQADTTGTVNLYTSGSLSLGSSSSYIKGNSITIYAKTGIPINGGYIETSNNGSIKLYTTGDVSVAANTYINGNTVTIVAQNSVTLSGGSINQNLSGAVTKIYAKDFTLNNSSSTISGKGIGMVMATNNISLSGGTAATTLMIAGNNINASNIGVTVAGLYSNGTINISGVKVVRDDMIATSLNLNSGSGSDFSIVSWSK